MAQSATQSNDEVVRVFSFSTGVDKHMAAASDGQNQYGLGMALAFTENGCNVPGHAFYGNGSSAHLSREMTISGTFRTEFVIRYGVSKATISETWQAILNHEQFLAQGIVKITGAVKNNGDTTPGYVEIDYPKMVKAIEKGAVIRINRDRPSKSTAVTTATKTTSAVKNLSNVIQLVKASDSDKKVPLVNKGADGKNVTTHKRLTAGQRKQLRAQAIEVLMVIDSSVLTETIREEFTKTDKS